MESRYTLSWQTLTEFYPRFSQRQVECRFCCPFPGCAGKRMNRAHESLTVNSQSGAYHCHRCHASGILDEFVTERRKRDGTTYHKRTTPRFVKMPEPKPVRDWREELCTCELQGTPGEVYLQQRGVALGMAIASQVRYQEVWWTKDGRSFDRPAVMFPIRGADGALVACQARFIADRPNSIRMQSMGEVLNGVFATATAWDQPIWTVTEAPIDALSLAMMGVPSMALCGTALREWLVEMARDRGVTIRIAFDNDPQGERSAHQWEEWCRDQSATAVVSLPKRFKDWNEQLTAKAQAAA